jgi:hypothetical protein
MCYRPVFCIIAVITILLCLLCTSSLNNFPSLLLWAPPSIEDTRQPIIRKAPCELHHSENWPRIGNAGTQESDSGMQVKGKYFINKSQRHSSVGIVTGMDNTGIGPPFLARVTVFTSPYCPDEPWGPPCLPSKSHRGKKRGRFMNLTIYRHTEPNQNVWSHTFTSLYVIWYGGA